MAKSVTRFSSSSTCLSASRTLLYMVSSSRLGITITRFTSFCAVTSSNTSVKKSSPAMGSMG